MCHPLVCRSQLDLIIAKKKKKKTTRYKITQRVHDGECTRSHGAVKGEECMIQEAKQKRKKERCQRNQQETVPSYLLNLHHK